MGMGTNLEKQPRGVVPSDYLGPLWINLGSKISSLYRLVNSLQFIMPFLQVASSMVAKSETLITTGIFSKKY